MLFTHCPFDQSPLSCKVYKNFCECNFTIKTIDDVCLHITFDSPKYCVFWNFWIDGLAEFGVVPIQYKNDWHDEIISIKSGLFYQFDFSSKVAFEQQIDTLLVFE